MLYTIYPSVVDMLLSDLKHKTCLAIIKASSPEQALKLVKNILPSINNDCCVLKEPYVEKGKYRRKIHPKIAEYISNL